MVKNIIKEVIIILLLALAIILILGIMLYEYVPSNKIIPETIAYITPESVQQELQTSNEVDSTEVVITYQIDSTDLKNYQKINEYIPGKKNPFEAVSENTEGNNNTSSGNSSTSSGNNTSGNNSNSGYLPNHGTK